MFLYNYRRRRRGRAVECARLEIVYTATPYQGFKSLRLRQRFISTMKTFNEQVYDIVAKIPAGRVATFGQIARMIGRPRMARFVGYASNNKNSWHLPWHRVVFKDGSLCGPGFFEQQYKALKSEGVKFDRDKKVKMDEFQWEPDRDGVPMDIRDFPLVF